MLIPTSFFKPPLLSHTYVTRQVIDKKTTLGGHPQIIFVEASGGYGKTVAVLEFLRAHPLPTIWYPLEQLRNQSLVAFVQNLLQAIKVIQPQKSEQLTSVLNELRKERGVEEVEQMLFERLLLALSEQIFDESQRCRVVLENYHCITNPKGQAFVQQWMERTTGKAQFILTSRSFIDCPQRQTWQNAGKLLLVAQSDLVICNDDAQWIAYQMKSQLQEETIAELNQVFQGWPFLFTLACRIQNQPESRDTTDEMVTGYLDELFLSEESVLQDFLCRTSILDELSGEICKYLLQMDNASQILHKLSKSIFLQATGDTTNRFYHHTHEIIRSYLRQRLDEHYSADDIALSYKRLGQYHESKAQIPDALFAYTKAKDCLSVEKLLEAQLLTCIDSNQLHLLEQWLAQLPPQWIEQSLILTICKGSIFAEQKHIAAQTILRHALQRCQQLTNQAFEILAAGELSYYYHMCGDYAQAQQILQACTTKPNDLRLLAYFHTRYALALVGIDQYGPALAEVENALQIRHQLATPSDKIAITSLFRLQALIHAYAGNPQRSAQVLSEAYHFAKIHPISMFSRAWILNNLAAQYRTIGDFELAYQKLQEAKQLLIDYRSIITHHCLYDFLETNYIHLRCDEYDDDYMRTRLPQQLAQVSQPIPMGWEEALYDFCFAHPEYRQVGFEQAQKRWLEQQNSSSPNERCFFRAILGIGYMVNGNAQTACEHIESALAEWYQHAPKVDGYYQICMRAYQAEVYFRLNRQQEALVVLRKTLTAMRERGFFNLEVWVAPIMAHLCYQALLHEIEPEFVEALVLKRFRTRCAECFLPLLLNEQLHIQKYGQRILQNIADQNYHQAYQSVQRCKIESIRKRLLNWLAEGWLTAYGLLYLQQLFSWREIETLLFWIHPQMRAEAGQIARVMQVRLDTYNEYLGKVKQIIEGKLSLSVEGRGAQMIVSDWAIKQNLINPHASTTI